MSSGTEQPVPSWRGIALAPGDHAWRPRRCSSYSWPSLYGPVTVVALVVLEQFGDFLDRGATPRQ